MRWLLLLGVWGLYSCFGLVGSSLAPLVRLVEHDLGISHAAMGGVLGAWQLVYMIAAIPCGILLDRLGSRWALPTSGSTPPATRLTSQRRYSSMNRRQRPVTTRWRG